MQEILFSSKISLWQEAHLSLTLFNFPSGWRHAVISSTFYHLSPPHSFLLFTLVFFKVKVLNIVCTNNSQIPSSHFSSTHSRHASASVIPPEVFFSESLALQVVKSHWSVISLCFLWPSCTFNMIIISFPGYSRFTWFLEHHHTLFIFSFFAGLPFEFFLFWFFFFSLILKRLGSVFGPFLYFPLVSQPCH